MVKMTMPMSIWLVQSICQNCFDRHFTFTSGNSWSQRQQGLDHCNEARNFCMDCHEIQLQCRFSQIKLTTNLWALWGTISILSLNRKCSKGSNIAPQLRFSLQVLIWGSLKDKQTWLDQQALNLVTCTCIGCTFWILNWGCPFYSFDSNLVSDCVLPVQLSAKFWVANFWVSSTWFQTWSS